MQEKTVNIKVETEGMEEATQQVQALADSFDAFPAQVSFKYLKNCTINVYPSQTKIVEVKNEND